MSPPRARSAPTISRGWPLSRIETTSPRPSRIRTAAVTPTAIRMSGAITIMRSHAAAFATTTSTTIAWCLERIVGRLSERAEPWREPDVGGELHLGRRLHRRGPGVSLQLQRVRLRAAGGRRRGEARARRGERARRRRDGRSGGARGAGADRGPAIAPRPVPRAALGTCLAGAGRVARVLAVEADLPGGVARPSGEARRARGGVGRERGRVRLPAPGRRQVPAGACSGALVARAPVPRVSATGPRVSAYEGAGPLRPAVAAELGVLGSNRVSDV